MAIARSEPFREQACPLGVCDGSGWILGPEDVARPCECRDAAAARRGRSRGVASVIPPRYRGVSFDRPPVTDMARDLDDADVVGAVREYVDDLDANLDAGPRALAHRRHRHRQDDARRCWSRRRRCEAGNSVAIYSLPKLLARIRQHLRVRAAAATPTSRSSSG